MKIGKISRTGGRPHNQDYADYAVLNGHICIAVADGLGAYAGSEVAGETAVTFALNKFRKAVEKGEDLFSGVMMNKLFKGAHSAILKAKTGAPNLRAGCTTLSLFISDGEKFIVAHEGDTRIYFFKDNQLCFYSKDHSLATAAVARGEILESEIRKHKDQNKLTRVLGSDYYVQPDFKIYRNYSANDSILICSDGFWEHIYEDEMEKALASSEGAIDALENLEKILLSRADQENCDNYTAVLLRFTDEDAPIIERITAMEEDKTEDAIEPIAEEEVAEDLAETVEEVTVSEQTEEVTSLDESEVVSEVEVVTETEENL